MKRTGLLLAAFLLCMGSSLQAQESEFGLWTSLGVKKSLNKKWAIGAEAEYRAQDNLKSTDRWSLGISTDYKLTSWLKAEAGYIYMHKRKMSDYTDKGNFVPAYWQPRHRVFVSFTGTAKLNRFKLSLRERWQWTATKGLSTPKYDGDDLSERISDKVVNGHGENVLRSKLQLEYDIQHSGFTPFISVEHYQANKLKKMRYTIGTEYELSKQHAFKALFIYNDPSSGDEMKGTIVSLGYTLKL